MLRVISRARAITNNFFTKYYRFFKRVVLLFWRHQIMGDDFNICPSSPDKRFFGTDF